MTKTWQVHTYRREDEPVIVSLLVHERYSFTYSFYATGGIRVDVEDSPIREGRFEKILRLFGARAICSDNLAEILPGAKIVYSEDEVLEEKPTVT